MNVDSNSHDAIEVLVVEDSPTQAGKLRHLLESKGYKVRVAGNGRIALDAIRERRPRLVLSDIIMPELDGYGLCHAIKSDPELRNIPVVLVTSLMDSQDIVRGLECGADNFIRKPYAENYLLERIEQVLLHQRLRREPSDDGRIAVYLNGRKHYIDAERQQILDLLISTYEQAVEVNEQLRERERQVNELNVRLAHHAAELEATNREIARQNEELERASRMKSEFLANMSHELRTPLNAIIGFSQAMKRGLLGELTSQQVETAGHIFDSGKHLLSLINDILDLSKIEAGKMDLDLEPTDINKLLQSTLPVFKDKAIAGRIHLRLEMETMGMVLVDPRITRQIVYNLLSNALKFTAAGGSVTLRMCRRPASEIDGSRVIGEAPDPGAITESGISEFLTIAVIDTGIGISDSDLARLFQPFVQLDSGSTRKYEGTGLGLSLVKQLVDLHKGVLTVRSAPQRGSEFMVWIPYRQAKPGLRTP